MFSTDESQILENLLLLNDSLGPNLRNRVETYRLNNNLPGECKCWSALGLLFSQYGEFKKAVKCHKKGLQIALNLQDKASEAKIYTDLGIEYRSLGKFEKALENHLKRLKMATDQGDSVGECKAYANIGNTYLSMCKITLAIENHRKYLALVKGVDSSAQGRAYGNLTDDYRAIGDINKALKYKNKNLQIAIKTHDQSAEADCYGIIGHLLFQLGNYDTALEYYGKVEAILQQHEHNGEVYLGIGQTYLAKGDLKKALYYFQCYRDIASQNNNIVQMAKSFDNFGLVYKAMGDVTHARECFQTRYTMAEAQSDVVGKSKALANLGNLCLLQGQSNQALEYFKNYRNIVKTMQDKAGVGKAYSYFGNAYFKLGMLTLAKKYHEKHLTNARNREDKASEGIALGNLAIILSDLYQFEQALELAYKSLEIVESLNQTKEKIGCLKILGGIYFSSANYLKSEEYYQRCLEIAKQLQIPFDIAATKLGLASVYQKVGKINQAIDLLQSCLQIYQNCLKFEERDTILELASIHLSIGEFNKAKDYMERHLILERELENQLGEVQAYLKLSGVYDSLGHYPKALELLEKALTNSKKLGNLKSEINVYARLGTLYNHMNNFPTAVDYHTKQLKLAQQLDDKLSEADSYCNLGNDYVSIGDFSNALRHYHLHLRLVESMKLKAGEGLIYGSIGNVYIQMNNAINAIEYFEKELAIAKESGDAIALGIAYGHFGCAYHLQMDFESAKLYLQKDLKISEQLNSIPSMGKALCNLGNVYRSSGDFESALECHQKDLDISKSILDKAGEARAHSNFGHTYNLLPDRLRDAEHHLRAAIDIWEQLRKDMGDNDSYKMRYFNLQAVTYEGLQHVLYKLEKPLNALEICERGRARALVDLLAKKTMQKLFDVTLQYIQDTVKKHKVTTICYSLISEDTRHISDTQELKAVILKGLYIWVIQKTGETTFHREVLDDSFVATLEKLKTEQSLDNLRKINKVQGGQVDFRYEFLEKLYKVLIKPIAPALNNAVQERVIIIPHKSLFLVPFSALFDKETQQYVIDRHNVIILPSIQVLDLLDQSRADHLKLEKGEVQNLVVGNPKMPRPDLPVLPFAKIEAIQIAKLLHCDPILGEKATTDTVLQNMGNSRYIHLATHGILDEIPPMVVSHLMGGIALAKASEEDDGFLWAHQIQHLNQHNVEMVVVSACNTGRGEITNDGVAGLSRAFISAGVQTVVVSLSPVSDLGTCELMTIFYHNIIDKCMDKDAALRDAMLKIKAEHPQNPMRWGSFIILTAC